MLGPTRSEFRTCWRVTPKRLTTAFFVGSPLTWHVRLAQEPVVTSVRANPEPMDTARYWHTERAVEEPDSDAVEAAGAHCFEVQRGVRGIRLELSVGSMCKRLNVKRQRLQALPETS